MPERRNELSPTGAAPAQAARRLGLPEGWPVLALFGAFPLWWALGLSSVIWVLLALPMLVRLLAPGRGAGAQRFGLWLAFLFWARVSATQLNETRRWYTFSYRAVLYRSMTVLFLHVLNLPATVPARRVVLALTPGEPQQVLALPEGGSTTAPTQTRLRCSSVMMRVRSAWASKRLSTTGRNRTGAGVSGSGRGASGRSYRGRPCSSEKRRSSGPAVRPVGGGGSGPTGLDVVDPTRGRTRPGGA